MNSTVKAVVFWLVIMVSAFLSWQSVKTGQNVQVAPEISYSDFISQIEAGSVSKVTISGTHVNGQYRDGRSFGVTTSASPDGMLKTLHEKNVEIWFKDTTATSGPAWLLNLAPLILLAALWFFMIRQMKQRQNQTQIRDNYPR
ncbi:MAG: ATP-dependent metallopeptidase FtsH/Yme1/Tma family protein [Terriglobales bacterium]